MKKTLLISIFCFIQIGLAAQFKENYGGKAAALGGFAINYADLWSVENNMGALPFYNKFAAGAYYSNSFLIKDLALKTLVVSYPLKNATFGLSISQYGYQLYQENKVGLSYGIKLSDNFGIGVQFNYFNLNIGEGYGSKNQFTAKIGLYSKISDQLSLAVVIINPSRAKINDYQDERLPTAIQMGLNYKFSDKLNANIGLSKEINFDTQLHFGIEVVYRN